MSLENMAFPEAEHSREFLNCYAQVQPGLSLEWPMFTVMPMTGKHLGKIVQWRLGLNQQPAVSGLTNQRFTIHYTALPIRNGVLACNLGKT